MPEMCVTEVGSDSEKVVRALVREETLAEVRASIEQVAASHDELAVKYPQGPDKIKAAALRRFAEVFL